VHDYTCFVGTIISETYATHPELRAACERDLSDHAAKLEPYIVEAMQRYGIKPTWSPQSLALHIQTVVQGAFVLAKAKDSSDVAAESLDHLRRYLEILFRPVASQRVTRAATPRRAPPVAGVQKTPTRRAKGIRK
jgi:TetR/AcrR family transcriptional repressor of nem operon